jgi:hypothetical protein
LGATYNESWFLVLNHCGFYSGNETRLATPRLGQSMLIEAIQKLAEEYPLEVHFSWPIPDNCPIDLPEDIEGAYARNVYLKEHLSDILANDETLDTHYWVIQDWGGIKSFKKNDTNNDKIREFIAALPNNVLGYTSYGWISSLSKIAAFLYPDQYSIYDKRAVYTLNWLLFRHTEDRLSFPEPSGQNSSINALHTQTLYDLSELEIDLQPKNTAYHTYCELLLRLADDALGEERPYKLEMLLFTIADSWVRQDATAHTEVQITTDYP